MEPQNEPDPNVQSDVTEPRFMNLSAAFAFKERLFTPAINVFLELANSRFYGNDAIKDDDLVVLPDYRLGGYLKVSEPVEN